jgi:hypothetical protein
LSLKRRVMQTTSFYILIYIICIYIYIYTRAQKSERASRLRGKCHAESLRTHLHHATKHAEPMRTWLLMSFQLLQRCLRYLFLFHILTHIYNARLDCIMVCKQFHTKLKFVYGCPNTFSSFTKQAIILFIRGGASFSPAPWFVPKDMFISYESY